MLQFELSKMINRNFLLNVFFTLFITVIISSGAKSAEPEYLFVAAPVPGMNNEVEWQGLKGINIDLLDAILKKMNVSYKINLYPWARAKKMVEMGRADVLFTCSYRKDRLEHFVYSDEFRKLTIGVVSRKDAGISVIKHLSDLAGQRVGVTRSYALHDELKGVVEAIDATNSDEITLDMLKFDRFKYAYVYADVTLFQIQQKGLESDFNFHLIRTEPTYICFNKRINGINELVKQFNAGLKAIRDNGTYEEISKRYWVYTLTHK